MIISSSYKGKRVIGADLHVQRFSPLFSWQDAWRHTDKHGAGEGAENSASSGPAGSRKKETEWAGLSI